MMITRQIIAQIRAAKIATGVEPATVNHMLTVLRVVARTEAHEKTDTRLRLVSVYYVARPEGFEPPTTWFVARYSIQLSYGRNI